MDISVEWGNSPQFLLASPGKAPGGLFWIVTDADEADVHPHDPAGPGPGPSADFGVTVRLGPAQAPVAWPIWWASVVSPMGDRFDLPREARTGVAEITVRGDVLYGSVRFSGVALDGSPACYEAVLRGHRAPGDESADPPASTLPAPGGDLPGFPVQVSDRFAPAGRQDAGPGPVISRVNALDEQVSLDFAAGRFDALLDHLGEAVGLRRELGVGATATAAWGRFLAGVRDSLATDQEVLAAIAARGHLGSVIAPAAAAIASAAGRLRHLDPEPPGLTELAAGVREAAGILTGLAARLRGLEADRERWTTRDVAEAGLVLTAKDTAVALTGSATRLEHHRDHLRALDPVGHARRTQEANRSALARMTRYVELWRARAATDWDKILTMERARPLHGRLVGAFLDLGGARDALAASEMARARAYADLMTGRRTAPVLTPARMSALLGEYGGPLVEYFLHRDRLIIFVVAQDGTLRTADQRVDGGALLVRIDELHEHLRAERVDGPRLNGLLRELGAVLWDPVARWLPADPETALAVVPHEALLRVPFHALAGADGRRLAERHTTTVLPAASILPTLLSRRTHMPSSPPPAPPVPAHRMAGGPGRSGEPVRPVPRICALVDPEPMPDGLPALRTLRTRFGLVSDLFPGAEVHIGDAATETAMVEGAARRPSVLCLATHAEALPDDPMGSFVALASGRLTAAAVHELDLPARLVVLAACETGAGRVTGDGVIGLSRAFLAAGPLAVLMTLWPVRERDSLHLLRRFHDLHLNSGLGTAGALRAAHLSLLAERPDDPQRWAAFTLFGLAD
ncbi:CHAT domain-containing protein [Sphaerisporangium corydalis]|uniref:CHAT domain-containing protein n=1 Tax=Sphaerisporangium corydalis TaxID=1441875 RepID=A0ABV9EKR7_9ACTN|nr:CHAT domain-containing protein [Sphaerisporangium corydalis]